MLAEIYAHLSEVYPSHGLEIVFVSGDRDNDTIRIFADGGDGEKKTLLAFGLWHFFANGLLC